MRIKEFGITVEALLARSSLARARLLAGESGLQRAVTAVSQIDLAERMPPASQGELFLTARPPAPGEAPALAELVRELGAAGASGLGLKSGGNALPPAVLEAADRLGLPLFEMDAGTLTASVANDVLTYALENQSQTLDKIQDLNRALTSTMLHGGNLQEICKILYQRFGNSVAISSDFLSSYVLNTTEDKRPAIRAILEEEKRRAYLGRPAPPNGVERLADSLAGQPCQRIVVPIYSDSVLHGRIYMWEDFKAVSAVELSVLESATSLIAMDMMKKTSILHIENSNRGGFLVDLLSGERRQYQRALSNARHFDFDPRAAHQVMVIRLRQQGQRVAGRDSLYQIGTSIVSILQQTVPNTVVKIIYANQGNQVVLLMESTPSGGAHLAQAIDDFTQNLYGRFEREGLAGMLNAGLGREYKSPAELYKSLAEARRALSFPGGGVVRFQSMGIYRLLAHEGVQAELELFCEQMLRPLLDYDGDKDARLVPTLTEYFDCSRNLTRLAERLGVHYNTVANRLQKIEDLTRLSLDDAEACLNLQVALKIYEMGRDEDAYHA